VLGEGEGGRMAGGGVVRLAEGCRCGLGCCSSYAVSKRSVSRNGWAVGISTVVLIAAPVRKSSES
jgi:hypothetical protein